MKKKRVTVWFQKSNKKKTKARVPDPDSLSRLRDYLEDDDLEFIAHGSTIDEGDQEATGKGGREANPPLARELEEEPKAPTDKEKSNEKTRGIDDALNMFFDGMDMRALEDYFGLGHLEVRKKDVPSGAGESSLSPKLVR